MLLPPLFFGRDTVVVARELLGREIIREVQDKRLGTRILKARIVETEAYLGEGDPAAHCARGPTPRAKVMFGPPGLIYVYFIYGNYFMLNFVTEEEGRAGAVLIRAIEPLEGLDFMASRRGMRLEKLETKERFKLTSGPAKLVMALGIDGTLNAKPLGWPHLAVLEGNPVVPANVVTTTRVGISSAQELPLRFYEKGNPYVSRAVVCK